jgi:Na+/H+ antiporter NhaD/arsenite permease-like protein
MKMAETIAEMGRAGRILLRDIILAVPVAGLVVLVGAPTAFVMSADAGAVTFGDFVRAMQRPTVPWLNLVVIVAILLGCLRTLARLQRPLEARLVRQAERWRESAARREG